MKKTLWVVVAIAIIVILGLLVSRNADGQTIKIGFIGPLTGSLANIGESSLGGAELAVKEINEKGGIFGKKITLIIEDDKCSAKGLDAITKLIDADKVVAISGPDCSSSASVALPLAQSKKVPVVIRWASAPKLAKVGDFIFRIYPSDAFQGKFVAEHIKNTLGKDRVAILNVKNDWGQGITDVFSNTFREMGGQIVYSESVSEDSRDMRTQLQSIKKTDAQVLFAPLHEATGIIGLKQAKDLGIAIPIIGGDVFESKAVIESSGANGVMYSTAVILNPAEFQQRVRNDVGKDGSKVTASLGYDSLMVIADAIRRAGTLERSAIRKALEGTSISGVSSSIIDFDQDGDIKQAQFEIRIIRDGQTTPIK